MVQENDPTSIEPFKPDLGKLRRECRSKEIKVGFLEKIIYKNLKKIKLIFFLNNFIEGRG